MDRCRSSQKDDINYSGSLRSSSKKSIHNSPYTLKYSSNNKNYSDKKYINTANKENSVPRKYKSLYGSINQPVKEHHHNRYQTDHQIEK